MKNISKRYCISELHKQKKCQLLNFLQTKMLLASKTAETAQATVYNYKSQHFAVPIWWGCTPVTD